MQSINITTLLKYTKPKLRYKKNQDIGQCVPCYSRVAAVRTNLLNYAHLCNGMHNLPKVTKSINKYAK